MVQFRNSLGKSSLAYGPAALTGTSMRMRDPTGSTLQRFNAYKGSSRFSRFSKLSFTEGCSDEMQLVHA